MEISKGLQREIVLVQNKLKNAICDHQICVGKLKDDPNNADIRGQIQQIQLHIVSLGRCQKQVVERLRKEVEGYQAQNDNGGVKLSVASLLGLTNNNNNINNNNHASSNNNNHITPNNDQDKQDLLQVKVQANGLPKRRRLSKDNFRNGVNKKLRAKETPVETLSIDDDVVELSNDENDSNEKEDDTIIDNNYQNKSELPQTEFLDKLGLITISDFDKLQSKKAERKRRSRANPQFVCSNWELPTKKKRHSYLQSGNAPQTRQTTARLNGPSPPPPPSSSNKVSKSQAVTKSGAGSPPASPSSSSSCPSSSSQSSTSKSLMPGQKPLGKPNILRNLNETVVRGGSNKTLENSTTSQTVTSNSNSSKSSPSKAMNIPGLPASLTIEKIENDVVCIHCRSSGMLSICDNCSESYHPACHIIVPPPQGQCPKCYEMNQNNERTSPIIKKSDEIGPAQIEARTVEQTREDPEVHKATGGFHKIDATTSNFNSNFGVQQLPPSIQLIPIGSGPLSTTSITQSNHSLFAGPLNISNNFISGPSNDNAVTYSPLIINQFPSQQPCIGPYMQPDPRLGYNYGMPIVSPSDHHHQQQHHQQHQRHQQQQPHSYLIIKKLSATDSGSVVRYQNQSAYPSTIGYSLPISSGPTIVTYPSQQPGQPIINYSIGTIDPGASAASQQLLTSSATGIPIVSSQPGVTIYDQRLTEGHPGLFYDQFAPSRYIPEPPRHNRQPTSRAMPGLNRIALLEPQNTSTKNSSSSTGSIERKRRKHNVRKNRDKKQRAMEASTRKCNSIDEAITAVLHPGNEPTKSSESSVNSSDNVSNNVTDNSQPRDIDIQPGSIVDRLYRRLAEDQEAADSPAKGHSAERTHRDEHLKLEEAHLSAPFTANLVSDPSNDRPHSCPIVKGSLYSSKELDLNDKENDNKNENEQGSKIVLRPGRRSLDSLQADLTNTCRLWTPGRNDFNQEPKKDFEIAYTEDTLTGDENDDPEPGRLEIESAEEEDEASDSPDNLDEEAIVSSIDMTVLEDFESAMRAEECAGTADSLLQL